MLRRLLAITYDLILLCAVLFFATAILTIKLSPETLQESNFLYPLYLLLWCYLYFAWHWVHGGQTLGMKVWKITVINRDRSPLDWKIASKRFLLAFLSNSLLGFGLLWTLFDSEKLTFYDRFSNTLLVKVKVTS